MRVGYERPTEWWVKGFGLCFSVRDHRRIPPLFSERMNGQHGIKAGRFLHLGRICVSVTPDRVRWRSGGGVDIVQPERATARTCPPPPPPAGEQSDEQERDGRR